MNILGVIAEFNPFHNGHRHLLATAKAQCKADYTIIVMSGNFTQRGEPAIYDKAARTRWALLSGADLVIEIPVIAATASAGDFARTGAALLSSLGIVTHLAFGCESADLQRIEEISALLYTEPKAYKELLKKHLKEGYSWPIARSLALLNYKSGADPALEHFLKQPNNILAIEYLCALQNPAITHGQHITPVPVQRIHAGYHDTDLTLPVCSATALRTAIICNQPAENYRHHFPEEIVKNALEQIAKDTPMIFDDFSSPLICKLSAQTSESLMQYADIDAYLCQRILNFRNDFTSFSDFCDLLNTKAYTRTRISRALLHVLLEIKKSDQTLLESCDYSPYIRVLGFKKASADVLRLLKDHAQKPVIMRPAHDLKQLKDSPIYRLCELDVFAADIYRSCKNVKSKTAGLHEFCQPVVIV